MHGPEQAGGKARIDRPLTSTPWAPILYELLTGGPPVQGADRPGHRLSRCCTARPPVALQVTVPRDLETICLKCLEKEPGKRYASAADPGRRPAAAPPERPGPRPPGRAAGPCGSGRGGGPTIAGLWAVKLKWSRAPGLRGRDLAVARAMLAEPGSGREARQGRRAPAGGGRAEPGPHTPSTTATSPAASCTGASTISPARAALPSPLPPGPEPVRPAAGDGTTSTGCTPPTCSPWIRAAGRRRRRPPAKWIASVGAGRRGAALGRRAREARPSPSPPRRPRRLAFRPTSTPRRRRQR